MMKTAQLNQLLEAIHNKEDKDINSLEKEVAEEIEDSVECDSFFKLPLTNIFSIVSKIDFLDIENYSKLDPFFSERNDDIFSIICLFIHH